LVDDSVKDFKIEIEGLTDRINEIRLNNHKYAADLIKTSNELKIEKDMITNIRKEIYEKFDFKVNEFMNMHNLISEHFEKVKSEFSTMKGKFTELSEFIKDVRFRRNLGVDVSRKTMKTLSNKISYDQQKSKKKSSDNIKNSMN